MSHPPPVTPPDEKRINDIRFRSLTFEEMVRVSSLTTFVPKQSALSRIERANIVLKGKDFARLRASRWLNDEIMNSFVALINSRNERYVRSGSGSHNLGVKKYSITDSFLDDPLDIFSRKQSRTHVFNTFFFPRLTQKGYDYSGVKRWLTHACLSILSLDLVLIPVHIENIHWVLTGMDMRAKRFLYLDSTYRTDTSDTIPILIKWLYDEVKDKHGEEVAEKMGIQDWGEQINPSYLPRQQDSGSCGIFTLFVADCLERGVCPNFTQRDIHNLRMRTDLFLDEGILPN